jgi:hypothetical protein
VRVLEILSTVRIMISLSRPLQAKFDAEKGVAHPPSNASRGVESLM